MISAVGNKVIVRLSEEVGITEGGIIIPEGAVGEVTVGSVVSVGTEVYYGIVPGHIIHFRPHVGYQIEAMGETLIVLEDEDILAAEGELVFEEEPSEEDVDEEDDDDEDYENLW